jgi:penicillin-binding protein 1C
MTRMATALAALALVAGASAAADRAFPPDLSRLSAPGGVVRDAEGRTLALRATKDGVWRLTTRVWDVPPSFLNMLIAVEDRRFHDFPGVDPLAVLRAVWQAVRAGHVVSGGSTFTMQVARLLRPEPRTLSAKLIECLRALQLSERFDKRQILSMWLSLAPFGGNLVGVEAASRAYFGEPARELDPAQAALLIALPRRPEALRPDHHPAAARRVRDQIIVRAEQQGLLNRAEAMVALAEPVPLRRLPMPDDVPLLFARRGGTVEATLQRPLQRALHALAENELQQLPTRVSLAVLIADLRTRAVLAAVPNEVGNDDRAGALDLTRAVRSPGSTLKPFLYALAFEDGLADPRTLLPDAPQEFMGYAPEDFSHRFSGRVTAADALQRSLNLPAVALLARYGPHRFVAQLSAAGLSLPPRATASLPVILGGAGITPRHLLALYCALATDGRVVPLRFAAGAGGQAYTLLSPAAAEQVAAILTRPFPTRGPEGIAWKTGTSAGNRDSWAIGFDHEHAVAVWIGRPDGSARPGEAAADTAVPVLMRVFGLLPPAPRLLPPTLAASTSPARVPELDPLRIISPPSAATLEAGRPILLRAVGGKRPLYFLVDGAPISSVPALRETEWMPPGPGFFHVRVLDAAGHSANISLRIVVSESSNGL